MSLLPPALRRLAALLVVLAILPVAFLVVVGEAIASDFNTAFNSLINWFRPWRWRDRHKRLRRFGAEVRLTADLLAIRWSGR